MSGYKSQHRFIETQEINNLDLEDTLKLMDIVRDNCEHLETKSDVEGVLLIKQLLKELAAHVDEKSEEI